MQTAFMLSLLSSISANTLPQIIQHVRKSVRSIIDLDAKHKSQGQFYLLRGARFPCLQARYQVAALL